MPKAMTRVGEHNNLCLFKVHMLLYWTADCSCSFQSLKLVRKEFVLAEGMHFWLKYYWITRLNADMPGINLVESQFRNLRNAGVLFYIQSVKDFFFFSSATPVFLAHHKYQ